MRVLKNLLLALVTGLLLVCSVSCNRSRTIVFDTSDPEALELDKEWAVITFRYVSFRGEPGFEEEITGQGRVGDILLVEGMRYVPNLYNDESSIWYKFEKGWLSENNVMLYSNKLKAKTASKDLLEN